MLGWRNGIYLHMINFISVGSEWVRYPVEHLAMYYSLFLLCCLLQHFSEITNFVIDLQGRNSIGWLANAVLPWKRQYDHRWWPTLQFHCIWKLPVISCFLRFHWEVMRTNRHCTFNLWQNLWKDICSDFTCPMDDLWSCILHCQVIC